MKKLYPHQAKFLKQNPDRAILAWEMRVGKTLPAALWIDDKKRIGNTYIVTPKQNVNDWKALKTKAIVLTKEQFKKVRPTIKKPTAIVIDEIHYFASPLFQRKRSQLSTELYTLIRDNPDMHVLGLTGTPIRQDAWSLHTLLCFIGVYYPHKTWRTMFFKLQKLPFLDYPIWVPKPDWRINIRPYLEKHCNIVSLRDVVKYLPPVETVMVKIKQPPYKKGSLYEIPTWLHYHRFEQQNKDKEILKLDYRKIIVVVHYTAQIDELKGKLEKEKPVFVLDGRTKNTDKVKKEAQQADDCYFIVQSSMGFGFDGFMFGAIVFASMSHSCLNHTQMLGRMRHQEHLKNITAYYLIGGIWDQRIYNTIEKGKDFNPHEYGAA